MMPLSDEHLDVFYHPAIHPPLPFFFPFPFSFHCPFILLPFPEAPPFN